MQRGVRGCLLDSGFRRPWAVLQLREPTDDGEHALSSPCLRGSGRRPARKPDAHRHGA
ncbi:hypothetical protein BOSE127_100449 [Bosea sp. 127]|nr:hypothetical protein BOSE127_100449 [Bosea sp. 127]